MTTVFYSLTEKKYIFAKLYKLFLFMEIYNWQNRKPKIQNKSNMHVFQMMQIRAKFNKNKKVMRRILKRKQ